MLKTAVVGVGNMGATHLICHKNSDYVQPIAVSDIYENAAKKIVDNLKLDIPVYADMEEMIKKESPDLIDIVSPTYTHKELSIKAMELGCHVLCEKPMALSVEDCEMMTDAAKRTGKRFMTAHVVRFSAPYMYLKNTIETKKYGKLLRLNMARNSGIPLWSRDNWMLNTEMSGGELIDLSIHDIDFVSHVLGMPDEISAFHHSMRENTEFSTVDFVYGDSSVSIEGGWYATQIPFKSCFTAYFEKGVLDFNGATVTENGKPVEFSEETDALILNGKAYSFNDPYRKEIEYFVDCIENGTETSAVLPESSTNTVALCLEILKKAETV